MTIIEVKSAVHIKFFHQIPFEIYKKDSNWSDQLEWGLLKNDSPLPLPSPIIEKLEYE